MAGQIPRQKNECNVNDTQNNNFQDVRAEFFWQCTHEEKKTKQIETKMY